jgi:hypothetical protein
MTAAQKTHQFMIDSKQAAEDRRLIEAANRLLASGKFDSATLDAIRVERDARAARFDAFITNHGARAVAY